MGRNCQKLRLRGRFYRSCGREQVLWNRTEASPIEFSFGKVSFDPDEIATVSLVVRGDQRFIQYITLTGHSYTGPVSESPLLIWIHQPTDKNPEHVVQKEILPSHINFLILKKRPNLAGLLSKPLFTLTLKDGQQLPVALIPEPISLSDGWKEKKLHPGDIIELWFEGGVQGTVVQGDVRDSLGFVFVTDRFLTLQTPKVAGLIKLPWERIAQLQAGQNGFKYEPSRATSKLVGAAVYLPTPTSTIEPETSPAGVRVTSRDSLGNKSGGELTEATGFLAVEPQAISAVEELGQETISDSIAPPALYKPEEEQTWAMEINFDETAPAEVAELDPTDLSEIAETTLYQDLPKVEVEPETFDLPPPEKEQEQKSGKVPLLEKPRFKKSTLTPEAIDRIHEILAEDELDDFKPAQEKESQESARQDKPQLTPEAIDRIHEILAEEDDLDDLSWTSSSKHEKKSEKVSHQEEPPIENAPHPALTPEAIDRIQQILAEDDDLDDLNWSAPPKRVQQFWDDLLEPEDEEELALLLPYVEEEDEEMEMLLEQKERNEADLLWSENDEDPELERTLIDSLF